jgi:protein SFI1
MHRFQPTRASPPIKELAPASSSYSISESGHELVPELQHLSPSDIDILDAVIQRAGSAATTFFTIFKAYSDVLQERGLDPQEVVYYGKLLKLGTLKGRNWGEKWEMVKAQAGKVSPMAGQSEPFFPDKK